MGMIHLMHQRSPECWYILEEGVDYIGAMGCGKVRRLCTEDFLQADSISDLMHQLHESGDPKWFTALGFIDSNGKTREELYPQHYEIHILNGFVPEVCDIRLDETCYIADWQVRYPSELWIRTDETTIVKVGGFEGKSKAAAEAFIEENGLAYSEEVQP